MSSPKRYYKTMNYAKAELMRSLYFSRQKKQAELAEMFGIRQGSVSRIVSGKVWV